MARVNLQLSTIERLGPDFVRAQIGWQQLEPIPPAGGRPRFDFAASDRWVAALAEHHLRWYVFGVGIHTPTWAAKPGLPASCAAGSPPARPSDFAAAMAAVARRYGDGGAFWRAHPELPYEPVHDYEVWNAPNHAGDWCPSPDPAAYARLYAATEHAVHSADPGAEVIVGGLATGPAPGQGPASAQVEPGQFLSRMLAAVPALRGHVDAVGVHVYAPTGGAALMRIAAFRHELEAIGMGGVRISWNEVGWPTHGTAGSGYVVTELARALYLRQVADADLGACGVTSLAPHTWVSAEQDAADAENWYGIADPRSAQPYPSALAYAEAIEEAAAGRYSSEPCK